ncbi:MAG: hypothetical protein GF398_17630 [Chitinivibrionales bacterium]|nr:hypothetical protein [Chitinivibrionales bacterium]
MMKRHFIQAKSFLLAALFAGCIHAANSGRTSAIIEEKTTAPSSWGEWRPKTGHVFAHNPVITEWRPGKFALTFYYAVYEEGENQDLYVTYDHGSGWAAPYMLANNDDLGTEAIYNPVIWQPKRDPDANMYLYTRINTASANGLAASSGDGGTTWSKLASLPRLPNGTVLKDWNSTVNRYVGPNNNAPLELPNGDVLFGTATEVGVKQMYGHIEKAPYGNYDGKNASGGNWQYWPIRGGGAPSAIIQPSFLVLSGDFRKLASTWRAGIGGPVWAALSHDGGKTWRGWSNVAQDGQHRGQSSVTLDNGWHVLCGEGSGRSNIKVSVCPPNKPVNQRSSWQLVLTLQHGDRSGGAYPTIIQAADRKVHLVYRSHWSIAAYKPPKWKDAITDEYRISHVILDPDKLIGKSGSGSPSISDGPSNENAAMGKSATFSVNAFGSGSLYYQWQRNTGSGLWQDVGRGADYSTEPAKKSMAGWKYRCVVTDAKGTSVSHAVVLSVDGATAASETPGNAKAVNLLHAQQAVVAYDVTGRRILSAREERKHQLSTGRQRARGVYIVDAAIGPAKRLSMPTDK